MSITDLEAVQQYEQMLFIEEALIGAETDVTVEEIAEVHELSPSCVHTYIFTYAHTYTHW